MIRKALRRVARLVRSEDSSPSYVPETVYPDDVFVVSYPKSGNTWVRFLIGNYLTGNNCSFENCHLITPDIHMNPERCGEIERPRFIKSHAPFRPQYPNVMYIVRDGRDVAVSYYHYSLKMGNMKAGTNFPSFLEAFNSGSIGAFGRWSDHVISWLDNDSNVTVVRYEDLLDDAERELHRILSFAGFDVIDKQAVKGAVEASAFGEMQRQEAQQHDNLEVLAKSDKSKRFIRKGKHGGWQDMFDGQMHRAFLAVHGNTLERMGYVTSP